MNWTHGHSGAPRGGVPSPEYHSWQSMKARCLKPSHKAFTRYGGRGITVCPEWMKFTNFLRDMGPRPEGTTLDRIDNDKGYTKENCRWASKREQDNNRSDCVFIEANGKKLSAMQWARELGISHQTLRNRIRHGWGHEKALFFPVQHKKKRIPGLAL